MKVTLNTHSMSLITLAQQFITGTPYTHETVDFIDQDGPDTVRIYFKSCTWVDYEGDIANRLWKEAHDKKFSWDDMVSFGYEMAEEMAPPTVEAISDRLHKWIQKNTLRGGPVAERTMPENTED